MSQFENPYADPAQQAEVKTSGLAITSLVCSLIFCCPVTTVIGVILGLIAVVTIGGNPMRKGKGLAAAGIIIGLLATCLQVWGGFRIYETMMKPVLDGPKYVLEAGNAGDVSGFKAGFHGPGAAATDAEATAFIAELQQRYGAFVSCEFSPNQSSNTAVGQTSAPFEYVLSFENATVNAKAEMIFTESSQICLARRSKR